MERDDIGGEESDIIITIRPIRLRESDRPRFHLLVDCLSGFLANDL